MGDAKRKNMDNKSQVQRDSRNPPRVKGPFMTIMLDRQQIKRFKRLKILYTVTSNLSTFGRGCLFHSMWCNII